MEEPLIRDILYVIVPFGVCLSESKASATLKRSFKVTVKQGPEIKTVITEYIFEHIHVAYAAAGGHVFSSGLSGVRAFGALRVFMISLDKEGVGFHD